MSRNQISGNMKFLELNSHLIGYPITSIRKWNEEKLKTNIDERKDETITTLNIRQGTNIKNNKYTNFCPRRFLMQ